MQSSDLPAKFPIPFGNNAAAGTIRAIPTAHQAPTATDAPASLYDGFPAITMQPPGSGGLNPSGADFNGIFYQATAWIRWMSCGVPVPYDASFSAAIGGYPRGAVVASVTTVGLLYRSTAENNTTNPDAGGAGWINASPVSASNGNGYWRMDVDQHLRQWGRFLTGVLSPNTWTTWAASLPRQFPGAMTGAQATLGNGGVGTGSAVTVMDAGTPYTGTTDPVMPAPGANQISGFVQNNTGFSTRLFINWECWGY